MQRALAFLFAAVSLLYFGAPILTIRGATAQEMQGPTAQQNALPGPDVPHIAVLLPLKSAAVGRQADAVRRGILEAQRVQPAAELPLVFIATQDDPFDVTQAYERAVRNGAQMVIGPLTRSAVSALATSNLVSVPTLALNAPEVDLPMPYYLYSFGLQAENEARQIADLAAAQGRRKAFIVVSASPLSKRLAEAFSDRWAQQGDQVVGQFQFTSDPASLANLRDSLALGNADMVFLALDAKRAKLIRSYLGLAMPVYATSLVYTSTSALANYELNGVIFVDMPWLLTPDHPAVLSYERPDPAQVGIEFERFYALGIDAYRVARMILDPNPSYQPLDGVTGRIVIHSDQYLTRELIPAQFDQGETRVLSEDRLLELHRKESGKATQRTPGKPGTPTVVQPPRPAADGGGAVKTSSSRTAHGARRHRS